MTVGFVLIKVEPGHEFWIYRKLSDVTAVKEVYPLFGEYDFIVKIVAENFEIIGNILSNKIRTITGVKDTETLAEMDTFNV